MAGRVIDISPAVGRGAIVWPGDTEFTIATALSPESGDAVTVTRVTMSAHTGAHADAPVHVGAGPADAAALPLDAYWGPCVVLDWRAEIARSSTGAIEADALLARLAEWGDVSRVLFRTLDAPLASFPETFPHFAPEAARVLAARGPAGDGGGALRLVGIDTFSIDHPASKDLAAHRALFGGGLCVLEELDLSAVAPGRYELVALPLRWAGADASPVRAALREW